eukprot:2274710-Pyramimonas_sp.AAC.1
MPTVAVHDGHLGWHDDAGTGKSYLGSRLVRILAELTGKVLVITAKNHALDEMLTDVAGLYGAGDADDYS